MRNQTTNPALTSLEWASWAIWMMVPGGADNYLEGALELQKALANAGAFCWGIGSISSSKRN